MNILDAKHVVGRAYSRLAGKLGRPPSKEELAEDTHFRQTRLESVASVPQEPMSLDAPRSEDSDACLLDFLADATATGTDAVALEKERSARVEDLLSELTPRERTVVRLRFGFDGGDTQCTLEQVGRKLGVTRERARQIQERSLDKLRRAAVRRQFDVNLLN